MKLNDDVLVVAVSPDSKYIAVALLDCTVKVRLICFYVNKLVFCMFLCLCQMLSTFWFEIVYRNKLKYSFIHQGNFPRNKIVNEVLCLI